jgi:hypothetical protein
MNDSIKRTALVTGASAGIGRAFAAQLAGRGFDLVLTARRRERLEELKLAIEADRGVRVDVVVADLADPAAPRAIVEEIARRGLRIDALVNNAGYGLPDPYTRTTWEQQAAFLQVLVTSVAQLTHLFVPGMVERGYGRIVNVMSLAGLLPGAPGNTLYAAAKAFGIKFTESLAAELSGSGVRVTAVCPGFTFSEFHDVNGTRERVQRMPSYMWMDADEVAREGVEAALRGDVVCVPGRLNAAIASVAKLLPDELVRDLLKRRAKDFRNVD